MYLVFLSNLIPYISFVLHSDILFSPYTDPGDTFFFSNNNYCFIWSYLYMNSQTLHICSYGSIYDVYSITILCVYYHAIQWYNWIWPGTNCKWLLNIENKSIKLHTFKLFFIKLYLYGKNNLYIYIPMGQSNTGNIWYTRHHYA